MPLANTIRLSDQLGVIRSVDYNSTFNRPTAIACDPPPTITRSGRQWTLILDCNLSRSTWVAADFNALLGSGVHLFSQGRNVRRPPELSFYFGVTLVLSTGFPVDIYLGYEWSEAGHYWWLGSKMVINLGTRQAVFLIAGRNALLSGSKDAFVFSAVK